MLFRDRITDLELVQNRLTTGDQLFLQFVDLALKLLRFRVFTSINDARLREFRIGLGEFLRQRLEDRVVLDLGQKLGISIQRAA